MNKTKIEWVKNPDGTQGYTWNPITGCLNHANGLCKGGGFPCYAYKLANGRLKQRYLANEDYAPVNVSNIDVIDPADDPFYPRFWEERLSAPYSVMRPNQKGFIYYEQKAKGIFVCDMGELFGDWIPFPWQAQIFQTINDNPQHRFYLLTKQPQNLIKWNPFPENCWVGVTATGTSMAWIASKHLSQIEAGVKFLSIEPLLSWETSTPCMTENIVAGLNGSLDWLVLGACTGTKKEIMELHKQYPELTPMQWKGSLWTLQPKIESLREIVEAADKAGIPVFLKDNLKPLFGSTVTIEDKWVWAKNLGFGGLTRQEMPEILYCSTCRVRRK